MRSPFAGLTACLPRKTPVLGRSAACRSMSVSLRTWVRYASSASRCCGAQTSAASGESAAMTKNVAPYSVSGRVVNTVTGSSRPSTGNWISAPSERPIQLRCISSTRSGHLPASCSMSASSRSAYSVILKYHCVSSRRVTSEPHRSHRPAMTCSLARTVWSTGHQLT
jgi:hypothetical protein